MPEKIYETKSLWTGEIAFEGSKDECMAYMRSKLGQEVPKQQRLAWDDWYTLAPKEQTKENKHV